MQQLLRRVADLERRTTMTVQLGRVTAVQRRPYRVQVDLGTEAQPVTTGWLHVVVQRAGASMLDFSPLDVGEGVLVLAPGGGSTMFVLPAIARGRIELLAEDSNTRQIVGQVIVGGVGSTTTITADDVRSGLISLTGHKHLTPAGLSGPPQA